MADDPTETPPAKGDDPKPDDLGDNGKKALDAERKARREAERQLKETQDRLAALEERDKTEGQKAADRAAAAEQRATDAEARALRLEVAASKGLTAAQAERLVGTTQEELEADADELLTTFKPSDDGKTPGKPTESLSGGSDPTQEPDTDIREVVESIPRGL